MANASQLFKDDEQERLGNGYVPDDDTLRNITGINKGEESGYDSSAKSGAAEDIANREKSAANDTGSQSGGGKSTGAVGLASAEALGSGMAAINPVFGGSKVLSFLWGSKKRKQATVGSGIIGLIVGGGFFGLSILSGPFQFIHIAQLLTNNHFSHQNNAGDDRVGRMIRYMRSGSIGETRLSYVESKFFKDPTLAQLKKLGFSVNLDGKTGINKGIFVTTEEGSPYHNMNNADIQKDLTAKYGKFGSVSQISDGKFYIKDSSLTGGLSKAIVSEANYSKIGTVVRARVLGKYTFASWHPLKVLDRKLNKSASSLLDAWSKARETRLKTGVKTAVIDASKAKTSSTDASGKVTTTDLNSPPISTSPSDIKSTLSSIKDSSGLKITGGVAAAVGIVCMAKTVDDNVPVIRYAQVIAPLIRVGMDAITVGNQVMSGKDVDMSELALLSKQFNAVDSSGNSTSWSNAASIKADIGQTGGTDISSSTKDVIGKDHIAALSWTQTPVVATVCSKTGALITGVFSFALGVISGETISTVVGAVVGGIAGPAVIDNISGLLAGEAVNVAAGGAEWGNNINYGARLAANSTAFQFGGAALSDKAVAQLDAQNNAADRSSFSSLGFFARTFNPYDSRTLASKLIDSVGNVKQTMASIVRGGFMKLGQTILSLPSKLFASAVHAAPQPYQYPFPEYGFSQTDLNNPLVADPYDNANQVALILDKNVADITANNSLKGTTGDYVARALGCFAVSVVKSDQGWDVIPADQSPGNQDSFNPYSSDSYSKWNCGDSSDIWLRIRFFIFDTGVMEGMGCYFGDQQSCSNDGFNSGGTTVSDVVAPILAENKMNLPVNSLIKQTASENINDFLASSSDYFNRILAVGGRSLKASSL